MLVQKKITNNGEHEKGNSIPRSWSAIVAARTTKSDPVHKISILPRGKALGYTLQLPLEDKFLMTKEEILSRVEVLVGGRVAEEIVSNEITNGAYDDIKRATQLVHSLICEYGMSKKLGTRKYGSSSDQVFLVKVIQTIKRLFRIYCIFNR